MKYVYKLYMFSTNYSIKETHEVYQNCHGIFSSLEEAEKALTDLMPIKWKFEKVDEDEIDNIRVIAFHIYEEPLNVCEVNCTQTIFIYDADGHFLEQQHGRAYGIYDVPFAGKKDEELAYKKGQVVYANFGRHNTCQLAVVAEVPLSPERAEKLNATCEDDVYIVYTADCEHHHMRPNDLFPIVVPLSENIEMLFSLVYKVAESRRPNHSYDNE